MNSTQVRELEQAGRDLAERLTGRSFGATKVERADAVVGLNSFDETSVFVRVFLNDPPSGKETWDRRELSQLRAAYREALGAVEPPADAYLVLQPATPEPTNPEDEDLSEV